MTLELRGANQFAAVAKALKEMGDKGLQREFNRALRDAAKPFIDAVHESALRRLPSHGGLAQRVAGTGVRVRKSDNRKGTGIRLVATGKIGAKDISRMNRGQVRHPVFGHQPWVTQSISPGFWDQAVEAVSSTVMRQMQAALDDVARKIDRAR